MDTTQTNSEESKTEDQKTEVTATDEKKEEAHTSDEPTTESEKEPEPEVIVENFEEKDKEAKTGFFADLNASPDSMSKWLGIVGGVLAVAFIAIFAIDMFMGKDDPSKNLDISKKETKVTTAPQQKQQELPMPEVYGAKEGSTQKTPPLPTKSSATTAPVPTATTAPTSAPAATTAPTSPPTTAPTSPPESTPIPTSTDVPSPTP